MTVQVALLLDSRSLQEWQRRAVVHLLEESDVDASVSLVVVNEGESSPLPTVRLRGLVSDLSLWHGAVALRIVRRRLGAQPWYRESTPLDRVVDLEDATVVTCQPEQATGIGHTLPEEVVSHLEDVDVAVRFGFGILKGDALTAPSYGVLSYHHGDLREYRGRPAGFYEFVHGEDTAGVTVQRLTEELDGGQIAASATSDIADAESWGVVRDQLFAASPPLLATAVQRCVSGGPLTEPETLGPLYTTPTATNIAAYLKRRMLRVLQ